MDFSAEATRAWLAGVTIERLAIALAVGALALVLVKLVTRLFHNLSLRFPRSRLVFKLLSPVVRFGTWLFACAWIVAVLAPTSDSQLAVLAALVLALGFGGQDFLRNVLGGLTILIDRTYQPGDRVQIGDAYGEIQHVGLRSTRLVTADDTVVSIPNGRIVTEPVWNANDGALASLVVTSLYLPCDADAVASAAIAREVTFTSPYLDLTRPVAIRLEDRFDHGPYVRVLIKAYVFDHRHEPAFQTDLTVRAKKEFLRRGVLGDRVSTLPAPDDALLRM